MLVRYGRSLCKILYQALHHLKALMVLQMHHFLPFLLPEGLELVFSFFTFIEGSLPCLVKLGSARATVLNIECLYLEVESVDQQLIVDIVRGWRRTIVYVPVQSWNMQHSGYSKGAVHTMCVRVLEYEPVEPSN